MKKQLLVAVCFAMVFGLFASVQPIKAQVYADFDLKLKQYQQYESIDDGSLESQTIPATDFTVPPSNQPNRDDGYKLVNLPFPFQFNGIVYTQVYICVNGFITFVAPPNVMQNDPTALFTIENSFADNVIAPYWGDHYYRLDEDNDNLPLGANHWYPSKILYKSLPDKFIVEWKDLNINDKNYTASIASFEVILYKSTDANSSQGSIEFAYGTTGKREGQITSDNTVILQGSSIGIKGENGVLGLPSDYMNALEYAGTKKDQITKSTRSINWQPTGGSEERFRFDPIIRYSNITLWGDGDADMSKLDPNKNMYTDQNRYVTVNDARVIMRSVATNTPLDSVRGRSAFHADVNHSGRFFYNSNGVKKYIKTRSTEYNEDLPLDQIGSEKQIMFMATEDDAATIMNYLGVKVPYLPWTLDTLVNYGKLSNNEIADNIEFGNVEKLDNDLYRIPVSINGNLNKTLSFKFNVNGQITGITKLGKTNNVMADFNNGTAVFASGNSYAANEKVAYITVKTNDNDLNITSIRFNDEDKSDVALKVNTLSNDDQDFTLQSAPNPMVNNTTITLNIVNAGNYILSVYDAQGQIVNVIANNNFRAGQYTFEWNGNDNDGNKLANGLYIYKLTGENVTVTKKIMIVK